MLQFLNNSSYHRFFRSFLIIIAIFMITGIILMFFINKKNVRIGFAAQLTGRQAEFGVQIRNGVQLAVDEINASGGIAGRRIELIVRDDSGIPQKANSVDQELIKDGVAAIIGHATTEQTLAGLKATNPAHVVMLGPTISTPQLSGIDDYFFRVYPSNQDSARALAQYIYRSGLNKLAIIYDTDNTAYALNYSSTFAAKIQALGGKITDIVRFSSRKGPDFSSLLLKLGIGQPKGLLIVASDIDTALIAQQTRLISWKISLFTSAWAQTEVLIHNGGSAVEGLKLEQSFLLTNQTPKYLGFKSRYQTRYGRDPSFGAAFGYDAAAVLAAALVKTGGKANGLRQALREIHNFPGLMNHFSFDRYGDVERPFYLSSIRNGKFIVITKLTSTRH